HTQTVEQAAEHQSEIVRVGIGAEFAILLTLSDDVGDQPALAAVQAEVGPPDGRVAAGADPDLHPQGVVVEPTGPEAGLLDEMDQLLTRPLKLILSLGKSIVELTVGVIHGLFQEPVLGLEVVKDRRRAGAGTLRDIADPGFEQAALVQNVGGRRDDLRLSQVIDFWTGTHLLLWRCDLPEHVY